MLALGGREHGPRDQEELQRTQRVFSWLRLTREYTQQQQQQHVGHRGGCLVVINTT